MANVKTTISIQKSLFKQAESLAREMKTKPNRLVVIALEDYLRRHENRQLLKKINRAYKDGLDAEEKLRLRQMRRVQRKLVEGEW
jgi:predicted transcriptional regulator